MINFIVYTYHLEIYALFNFPPKNNVIGGPPVVYVYINQIKLRENLYKLLLVHTYYHTTRLLLKSNFLALLYPVASTIHNTNTPFAMWAKIIYQK